MARVYIDFEDSDLPQIEVRGPTKALVLDRFQAGSDDCCATKQLDERRSISPSDVRSVLRLALAQGTFVRLRYVDAVGDSTEWKVRIESIDQGSLGYAVGRVFARDEFGCGCMFLLNKIESAVTELA